MKRASSYRPLGILFLIVGIALLGLWYTSQKTPHAGSSGDIQEGVESIPSIEAPLMPSLEMGIVELNVSDLDSMGRFYNDITGFDVISSSGNILELGEGGRVFLRLYEEKNFQYPDPQNAGLYHIAITHTSRKDLAIRLQNILEKAPERYQGSSDHIATEAFYFSDPEGNGVELYYDRPRKDWKYQDGKPIMGSSYIDPQNYILRYADIPVSEGETKMGHIHLKIGDIGKAKEFYEKILLFEEMSNRGDALFISRDGYHHHLGLNTWESLGAEKRKTNLYGLRSYELIYSKEIYDQIVSNLKKNILPFQEVQNIIIVDDPWGNTLKIRQS